MNDDLRELGRRAVACSAFRWLPGMRLLPTEHEVGGRVVTAAPAMVVAEEDVLGFDPYPNLPAWSGEAIQGDCTAVPDLSDPATIGCVLALVRGAWGEPAVHMIRHPTWVPDGRGGTERATWWAVTGGWRYVTGPTEAAALVAALESAPWPAHPT